MVVRFAVDRRCAPVVGRLLRWRWRIGSMVRGKYWMVMEWYRRGNEVVSRKIAGKKHIEGRMKIGGSLVINPIILRVSYVYVTYILRIWYVNEKGKTRGIKNLEVGIMKWTL